MLDKIFYTSVAIALLSAVVMLICILIKTWSN
jgi:hypothetical protein